MNPTQREPKYTYCTHTHIDYLFLTIEIKWIAQLDRCVGRKILLFQVDLKSIILLKPQ